jgi:hypothetical protein
MKTARIYVTLAAPAAAKLRRYAKEHKLSMSSILRQRMQDFVAMTPQQRRALLKTK